VERGTKKKKKKKRKMNGEEDHGVRTSLGLGGIRGKLKARNERKNGVELVRKKNGGENNQKTGQNRIWLEGGIGRGRKTGMKPAGLLNIAIGFSAGSADGGDGIESEGKEGGP